MCVCSKHNNKTPTTSDELFCVIFVPDFSFIFFIFYSKKLYKLMASSHQQRPNGASVVPLSKYKLVFLGVRSCYHRPLLSFVFVFCFRVLSLSRSSSSSSSSSSS